MFNPGMILMMLNPCKGGRPAARTTGLVDVAKGDLGTLCDANGRLITDQVVAANLDTGAVTRLALRDGKPYIGSDGKSHAKETKFYKPPLKFEPR